MASSGRNGTGRDLQPRLLIDDQQAVDASREARAGRVACTAGPEVDAHLEHDRLRPGGERASTYSQRIWPDDERLLGPGGRHPESEAALVAARGRRRWWVRRVIASGAAVADGEPLGAPQNPIRLHLSHSTASATCFAMMVHRVEFLLVI